jgi:uncharacterized membrane protein YtjA (UPF0391 family)
MFRWSIIFLVIAAVAALTAFGGKGHDSMHLGLYIAIIFLILAIGSVLLRRRSESKRRP